MISYEFNFLCEGQKLIGQRFPGGIRGSPHVCEELINPGVYSAEEGIGQAWKDAAGEGWCSIENSSGETLHLCPACAAIHREQKLS